MGRYGKRGYGRGYDDGSSWGGWPQYVPVAERRANAVREAEKLAKKGQKLAPVKIEGRTIAKSFWGASWCTNLESYSDYASRLPRGRTYVRNGSVIDLQLSEGKVHALVSGSEIYKVDIGVKKLADARWSSVVAACAGHIDSVVELLKGRLSKGVMEVITRKGEGLFPDPKEITMKCSCPDWATMCKHVAAVLYGVGSRLDSEPELLFVLRGVDKMELIERAASGGALSAKSAKGAGAKKLEGADLSALFGIEMEGAGAGTKGASAKGAGATVAKSAVAKSAVATGAKSAAARSAAAKGVKPVAPTSAAIAKAPNAMAATVPSGKGASAASAKTSRATSAKSPKASGAKQVAKASAGVPAKSARKPTPVVSARPTTAKPAPRKAPSKRA